jgi:hypothetical protein
MHKRRPSHNYTQETKKKCLELIGEGNNEGVVSLRGLAQDPLAPARSTLQEWRRREKNKDTPHPPPKKRGPPPKLTWGEILVVGGWIFEQNAMREVVSGRHVATFIGDSFNEQVVKGTVSKYLGKLHITSHSSKVKEPKYLRPNLVKTLHQYGIKLR